MLILGGTTAVLLLQTRFSVAHIDESDDSLFRASLSPSPGPDGRPITAIELDAAAAVGGNSGSGNMMGQADAISLSEEDGDTMAGVSTGYNSKSPMRRRTRTQTM